MLLPSAPSRLYSASVSCSHAVGPQPALALSRSLRHASGTSAGSEIAAQRITRETVAEPTLWNLRKTGNGAPGLARPAARAVAHDSRVHDAWPSSAQDGPSESVRATHSTKAAARAACAIINLLERWSLSAQARRGPLCGKFHLPLFSGHCAYSRRFRA